MKGRPERGRASWAHQLRASLKGCSCIAKATASQMREGQVVEGIDGVYPATGSNENRDRSLQFAHRFTEIPFAAE
jgi:hypothetical protein